MKKSAKSATSNSPSVKPDRIRASRKEPNAIPRLPAEVIDSLNRASTSGQWLIAVLHVAENTLNLTRTAVNFPAGDLDLACRLFVENLQEFKQHKAD